MAVFRVSLRGEIFGKGHRSDGASALAGKWLVFLAGGLVGAAAEADQKLLQERLLLVVLLIPPMIMLMQQGS